PPPKSTLFPYTTLFRSQRTCPLGQFSIPCRTVTTKRSSSKLTVCILSPHPLVLSEFERILAKAQFKVALKQLESTLAPDLRTLEDRKSTRLNSSHVAIS